MWTLKSCSTVATAAPADPYEYAPSIFPEPPVEKWTHRSRGMDSIVTCLVEGTTRTRIIDWVRTWSELNLESSSDPRSRIVNAPVIGAAVAEAEALAEGEGSALGVGTSGWTWPKDSIASWAAGTKYAMPPANADMKMASTTIRLVRKGLRRRRDALARCPGLKPSGTGRDSTPGPWAPCKWAVDD